MYREDLAPRISFDQPVEMTLRDQDSLVCGRASNLSPNGLFVRAPVLLAVGTAVTVRCELTPGVELVAEATVVRAVRGDGLEPSGMGLRFDEMEDVCAWCLAAFVDRRLQPGRGAPVRLQIGELASPVRAVTQGSWENLISVDAALPFLKLGSNVCMQDGVCGEGRIRWVEVHVCPETGVPRLNLGIELATRAAAAPLCAFDEERDPVCTDEYLAYARSVGQQVRHEAAN